MKYELWCGDELLGRSDLQYPQLSAIAFAGEFEPAPGAQETAERLAVAIHCMTAWMNRDTRDRLGRYVVQPAFRNSRLFTVVTETIASRHNPALSLRRPDGTVIPTRHLIIQDMGTLTEHIELLEEAMRRDAEQQENEESRSFDETPHASEWERSLCDNEDDEQGENRRGEAWRGGVHPTERPDVDAWASERAPMRPRSYLNLHVMIEHAGDIPADTSWLAD